MLFSFKHTEAGSALRIHSNMNRLAEGVCLEVFSINFSALLALVLWLDSALYWLSYCS